MQNSHLKWVGWKRDEAVYKDGSHLADYEYGGVLMQENYEQAPIVYSISEKRFHLQGAFYTPTKTWLTHTLSDILLLGTAACAACLCNW